MPASKEFWERHPELHCTLHFVGSFVALYIGIDAIANGGFGKRGAPSVTPQSHPIQFWAGVVLIFAMAIGVFVAGLLMTIKLRRSRK